MSPHNDNVRQEQWKTTVERLQTSLETMRKSGDIHEILKVVYKELVLLVPAINACSVQVLSENGIGISYQITHHMVHDHPMNMIGSAVEVAWREQRVIYRPDLTVDDPYNEGWLLQIEDLHSLRVKSVVNVPFRHGTLTVNSTQPHAFSQEDIEILEKTAQILTKEFDHLEHLKEWRKRTEILNANATLVEENWMLVALYQITQAALALPAPEYVMDTLAERVVRAGIFRRMLMALVDTRTRTVKVIKDVRRLKDGSFGWNNHDVIGLEYTLDDRNILSEVARTGEMQIVAGWDDRFDRRLEEPERYMNRVSCFFPVTGNEGVVAVVATDSTVDRQEEMLHRVEMLRPWLNQVIINLEYARLYREARQSQEQLRALSVHIRAVREEERTRIAREIHDELGQTLTGLKMDLAWLDSQLGEVSDDARCPLLERTTSMKQLIDTTIQTTRRICSELRPGILDTLGLPAAIEWQVYDFQQRTGIRCRLTSGLKDFEIAAERSTAIFRIFQEILTNVARHANATGVSVKLKRQGGSLLLEVRDNGRGITESEVTDGQSLGLMGMREWALLLGGNMTIEGKPGKGTTVVVQIPLNQTRGIERRYR